MGQSGAGSGLGAALNPLSLSTATYQARAARLGRTCLPTPWDGAPAAPGGEGGGKPGLAGLSGLPESSHPQESRALAGWWGHSPQMTCGSALGAVPAEDREALGQVAAGMQSSLFGDEVPRGRTTCDSGRTHRGRRMGGVPRGGTGSWAGTLRELCASLSGPPILQVSPLSQLSSLRACPCTSQPVTTTAAVLWAEAGFGEQDDPAG